MWEVPTDVLVAAVTGAFGSAGLVLAAVLPSLVKARQDSARAATGAVQAVQAAREARGAAEDATYAMTNGHAEHARDQWDRQHAETLKAIGDMRGEFVAETRAMKSDIRGIRRDVGAVRTDLTATTTRLDTAIARVDRLADEMSGLENTVEALPKPERPHRG